ncbi:MAG: sarcosine oxidase subunit delta [Novosphingobium sp.]
MMQIPCPHCGPRDQAEFVYERTIDSLIEPGADDGAAMARLYTRTNPKGIDQELWRHTFGCRAWLVMTRDRVTNAISETRAIGPEALP